MAKKRVDKFYPIVDRLLDQQAFIESIEAEFQGVQDPRATDNVSYSLSSLLVIILAAVLYRESFKNWNGANSAPRFCFLCGRVNIRRQI
jgi:hypothetical protein